MKTAISATIIAFLAAASIPGMAERGHEGVQHEGDVAHESGQAAAGMSEGTVKRVDKSAGTITIAHGPLENLGMPAMTMAFWVKDKAMLEQVQAGDKIRFRAADLGGTLTVTSLETPE